MYLQWKKVYLMNKDSYYRTENYYMIEDIKTNLYYSPSIGNNLKFREEKFGKKYFELPEVIRVYYYISTVKDESILNDMKVVKITTKFNQKNTMVEREYLNSNNLKLLSEIQKNLNKKDFYTSHRRIDFSNNLIKYITSDKFNSSDWSVFVLLNNRIDNLCGKRIFNTMVKENKFSNMCFKRNTDFRSSYPYMIFRDESAFMRFKLAFNNIVYEHFEIKNYA